MRKSIYFILSAMLVTSCDDNKFISEYYTEDVTVDVTNGLWSIERLEECYYSFQGEHNETGAYCNTDYILTNPNGSATIYTVCKYQDCDTVRYVNYDSDGKSITLQYQDGTNETWNFGSIHAVGTGGSADLDYYMLYQKGKTKKGKPLYKLHRMMEIRTDTMAKELGLPVPIVPKERVWSDKNICGFYSSQDGNKYNFKTDGIVSRKKSNGNEAREDGEYALMNNGENDILTIRFKDEERTGPIVFDDGIFFFYDGNEGERTVFSRIKPVKSLR